MDCLYSGAIANQLSRRNSIALDFSKKMAELVEVEVLLKKILLQRASKGIQPWLRDNVVENLFEYGKSDLKIWYGYGVFGDLADIKKKMGALSRKWKGLVTIKLLEPEVHRVHVIFKVCF